MLTLGDSLATITLTHSPSLTHSRGREMRPIAKCDSEGRAALHARVHAIVTRPLSIGYFRVPGTSYIYGVLYS